MHLQNLVLDVFTFCDSCQVHASYVARAGTQEIDTRDDISMWARSRLWVHAGSQLSSIHVQDHQRSLEPFSNQEVGLRSY